ncbi:MAG: hypothetical protein RJA90_2258, partial [Bacteroidota bacterium]
EGLDELYEKWDECDGFRRQDQDY